MFNCEPRLGHHVCLAESRERSGDAAKSLRYPHWGMSKIVMVRPESAGNRTRDIEQLVQLDRTDRKQFAKLYDPVFEMMAR